MRKYQPIWDALKNGGTCRITVAKELHPRIVKAVCKEKHNDVGYELLLSEEGKRARLDITYDGAVVNFKLIKSLRSDNI